MRTKIKLIMLFLALFAIRANSQITIDSIHIVNATSCHTCNGSAIAYVSGGFTPYTYYWSNIGYDHNHEDSFLCPGTYYVQVSDAHGDTTTYTMFTIGPASVSVTMSSTNTGCIGNTGTATATVTGGTAPYTYLWTPGGGTTATITGLSSGTYSVTVTDSGGCTQGDSVYVGENHLLFDSVNVVNASCAGNDGSASINVTGGTAPYTYLWTPGGETTATATGLSAGTYTVTVNDHLGCSLTSSVTISNTGPVPTIVTGNDSCYGQSNGFATVTSVSGGVAPYTYSWAPSGSTNSSINGLSAGNYTVTVTDKNGCSGTTLVSIYQPAQLTFTDTTTADTGGCTGGAWIIVSGGTGPYTFTWSSHVNSYMDTIGYHADSMCAGAYLLCITDANGCTTCDSVHIPHSHILGIGNIKENISGIKVYPDPVSDRLNVATEGLVSGTYSIFVYDMIGRQVLQNSNVSINPGETIQVNVSGLPAGKYMLRLSGTNSNKIAPFIVTH